MSDKKLRYSDHAFADKSQDRIRLLASLVVTHEARVAYFLRAIFHELPSLCLIIGYVTIKKIDRRDLSEIEDAL